MINAAVAGFRYPAVIIVELKAKEDASWPLSLWRFTDVLVTNVRRAYGDLAFHTWALQLKANGVTYYAPGADYGTWEGTRACYSTVTGLPCDKLTQ